MEHLDPSQRESIKKMSTERLRVKLAKADFDEQQLTEMSREQLLEAWAKVVVSGKDVPPPAAAAAAKAPTVGYDVELERRRLEFEMKKFEAEEARRKEEFEVARLREEREEARRKEELEIARLKEEREETLWKEEMEAARAKEKKEAGERIAVYQLQEQELQIRRDQWEWQKRRDIREGEKQQTPAAQVKFFGDVLKNVMPRFPNEVADVPIFFEGVEKLFKSFEVPDSLQSELLLPYLSDKAKSL
jgi:hypothetical protein